MIGIEPGHTCHVHVQRLLSLPHKTKLDLLAEFRIQFERRIEKPAGTRAARECKALREITKVPAGDAAFFPLLAQ